MFLEKTQANDRGIDSRPWGIALGRSGEDSWENCRAWYDVIFKFLTLITFLDSPKKPEANGKKAEENGESSKTNGKKAKGRKRKNVKPEPEPEEPTPQKENSKLIVDYAKSDKGKCGECANKMDKGSMRIKYKNKFYHPLCLKKVEEVYIDKAQK